jgi:hypothetical protein
MESLRGPLLLNLSSQPSFGTTTLRLRSFIDIEQAPDASASRALLESRQPLSCHSSLTFKGDHMAKSRSSSKKSGGRRRYGKAAGKTVASAMRRKKRGTLKSGRGGKGGTVKSRKQAIAIGLSEARKKGAKVPKKKAA